MNVLHHEFAAFYGEGAQVSQSPRALSIPIPEHPGSVHYVLTMQPVMFPERARRLRIEGTVHARPAHEIRALGKTPGGLAPNCRPILLRNWSDEHARWWYGDCVFLDDGKFSLSADLEAGRWSSVYGAKGDRDGGTREMFAKAVNRRVRLGLTFGGRDHFGHGVTAQKPGARVVVNRFVVE